MCAPRSAGGASFAPHARESATTRPVLANERTARQTMPPCEQKRPQRSGTSGCCTTRVPPVTAHTPLKCHEARGLPHSSATECGTPPRKQHPATPEHSRAAPARHQQTRHRRQAAQSLDITRAIESVEIRPGAPTCTSRSRSAGQDQLFRAVSAFPQRLGGEAPAHTAGSVPEEGH